MPTLRLLPIIILFALLLPLSTAAQIAPPNTPQAKQPTPTPTLRHGGLEVVAIQPEPGSTDIHRDTVITVFFNRPVVSLTAIEKGDDLPDPLTFNPFVDGVGEWLDTSTYRFTPDSAGFRRATEYTARIPAGLTDVLGEVTLAEDYEWQFTTIFPTPTPRPTPTPTRVPLMIRDSQPEANANYVSPSDNIYITFTQPMYRREVQNAFQLTKDGSKHTIPGTFIWIGRPERMVFNPDEPLEPSTRYRIELPAGLSAEFGSEVTQNRFSMRFVTAPKPKLTDYSLPSLIDNPREPLTLSFNNSMNTKSFVISENLTITPHISKEFIHLDWQKTSRLEISLPLEFSQQYTLTLGADIKDKYGQELGQSYTLTWQTKPDVPIVLIESYQPIATYNAYADATILLTTQNVHQVDFSLYRLPVEEFIGMNQYDYWRYTDLDYTPPPKTLAASWQFKPDTELNQTKLVPLGIGQESGLGDTLPPGVYYLEATVNKKNLFAEAALHSKINLRESQILVVSRYHMVYKETVDEGLVWVTDLLTGHPTANLPLTFVSLSPTGATRSLTTTTNADGVARVSYAPFSIGSHKGQRNSNLDETRFVIADEGQDNFGPQFGIVANQWQQRIQPYHFDDVRVEEVQPLYYGYVYTHRGLYRPGNTVYFKGIIRQNHDATYILPTDLNPAKVIVYDPQGQEIYNKTIPLNDMGSVDGTLVLANEAALGEYDIRVEYGGQTFYTSFEVAAYRTPEFQLQLVTDQPRYAQGETIVVTATAQYFFGGPLANSAVRWTVFSDDYAFQYDKADAFDFVDDAFNNGQPSKARYGTKVAEGTGQTDETGQFTFEIAADVKEHLMSQLYTIDLIVTDMTQQELAIQTSAIVDKSRFLMGLRPQQLVSQVGQTTTVDLLLVDWNRQPITNQAVQIVVSGYNRYSVQQRDPYASRYRGSRSYYWRTFDETVPIMTTTITTDEAGQAVSEFLPEQGGIYQVRATTHDADENPIQTSTFVWISGSEYVNWAQDGGKRFELVPNKPTYEVGETANILVPHPYSGTVYALVTQERGRIHEYEVVKLPNNSHQLHISITEEMLPNMYLSVIVVEGANLGGLTNLSTLDVDAESRFSTADLVNNFPSFKMAYLDLPINPAAKSLNITMTPDKPSGESYQPRDTVTYNIEVTDAFSQPVKAELSLALVDQALLSLAPQTPGQMLARFWRTRGLGVQTASSLTKSLDEYNQRVLNRKGGDGCADCGVPLAKGGGKTRRNFLDTALWVADFVTDENGKGQIEATLPDNLTTWTLTGIGVTGADTRVGESSTRIISTIPVLVRPVTPRFMVVGDEMFLGMIVQNNSEQTQTVETLFEADGLSIGAWRVDGGAWSDAGNPTFTLEAGQRIKVEYQTGVEVGASSHLTMTAIADDFRDSLTFELPVYRNSAPETVATSGILSEEGRRTELIELPENYDPTQGDLTVSLEGSLAAGMRDGLDYLEHYPYECTEQTVSRFLPNVVTYQAYQRLNLENPDLKAKLPALLDLGRQKLYNHHHTDGGWGWWVDDESNPYLTAYVLQGLLEAKRAGFEVSSSVVERGLDYLQTNLYLPKELKQSWQANRQAFMLYVLAEGGQGDLGRSIALYDQREKLDRFGQAYLAMAIHRLDAESPQLKHLLNDLMNAATVTASGVHWTEEQADRYAMNTDTRSTAIIIGALARIEPDNPLLPKAVRWLMTARSHGGYWRTTQETAWAIMGLTEWMVATGELAGAYEWQVTINGERLGDGSVRPESINQNTKLRVEVADLLADVGNRLVIERLTPDTASADEAGNLYYGAYLTYYQPATEAQPLNRGIAVSREYYLRRDQRQRRRPITEALVGDVIEVKLRIETPTNLHYVLIEDPFPAGTEPINSNLATSSLTEQTGQTGYNYYFSHTELRDEKAALFATYLPQGVHEYTYLVRATLPGDYRVIPTHAEEMYFPEVFGRGAGGLFRVRE